MEGDQAEAPEPERQRVKCAKCGALTDVEEVTTARGQFYCPKCVDGTIAIESVLPFREKYDNRAIRWTMLGCFLLPLVVVFGSMFILVYTFMRLDTQLDCKARMEMLYKVMVLYAGAQNAYPPENNDFRPLYDKRYTTNFHLFVCPGTKNTVTTVDHLKDDSTSREGAGMSYFYQGGHGFVLEEGEEGLPLFWDQDPANHRDKGVNVLFRDGHHEWLEEPPKLQAPESVGAH